MNRKQKLVDLEAEDLANALLELAAQSGAADDLVERLIATPTENVQTAYSWLNKIPENETFQSYERDQKRGRIHLDVQDQVSCSSLD